MADITAVGTLLPESIPFKIGERCRDPQYTQGTIVRVDGPVEPGASFPHAPSYGVDWDNGPSNLTEQHGRLKRIP